jgi:hypothetical protein
MVCGPWPDYYIIVALGPCNERGRPEQCQLRGGTGKRCQKYAVAPSNASSGATGLAYGKYWRRELPGLEPVRQWKIRQARARELAYGKCWRLSAPANQGRGKCPPTRSQQVPTAQHMREAINESANAY